MSRGPGLRTGRRYSGIHKRFSTSTLILTGLIYVAWGTVSAVVVIVIGLVLAAVLSRIFVLDRPHVAAVIITALAAVAGLSAPIAVTRLQTSFGRTRVGGTVDGQSGHSQP